MIISISHLATWNCENKETRVGTKYFFFLLSNQERGLSRPRTFVPRCDRIVGQFWRFSGVYQSLYGGRRIGSVVEDREVQFFLLITFNEYTSSSRRGTLADPSVPFFFLARHFALSMGICRLPVHAVLCWSHMHAPVRNKYSNRVVLLCKLHMHLCKLCRINVTARFIGLALDRVWKKRQEEERGVEGRGGKKREKIFDL